MLKNSRRILAHLIVLRATQPKRFWAGIGAVGLCAFGAVASFATAPSVGTLDVAQREVIEPLGRPEIEVSRDANVPFVREERIIKSDTFGALLRRLGVNDPSVYQFVLTNEVAQRIFEELRPGKVVMASTLANGRLVSLTFPLNDPGFAIVLQNQAGTLSAQKVPLAIETRTVVRRGEIRSSFFAAADAADLPDSISMQMSEIFGGEIDFHRNLQRGDHFSVVFEMGYVNGRPARTGRLLAAEFVNEGEIHRAVWFADGSKDGNYYTPDGRSLKAAFLRSPIEFSRISSGFSMRLHPILHIWRAHRGVDYAAPTGTPVRATADGVVDEIGRKGGYGNLVVLRHWQTISTLYGHLDGFAMGLRRGTAVRQGEIIGYVGRTGWATGPHLHYEFRVNDVPHDPLKVAAPTERTLDAGQFAAFRRVATDRLATLERLRTVSFVQAN